MSRAPNVIDPVLLLDVGSTFVKGAVVARSGGELLIETQDRMPEALSTAEARHEIDALRVLSVVKGVAETLIAWLDRRPVGVMMSTQMHSCLVTERSGKPVSPIITWQDDRLIETNYDGSRPLDWLVAQAGGDLWQRSGVAMRPGFGAGNLGVWLRENPNVQRQGLRIHTLGSYLSTELGGPYATGLSNAASLGLVDISYRSWSSSLLALHGVSGYDLPTILTEPGPVGSLWFGDTDVTWFGDIGDHQASVLGAGGLDDDEMAISLGTAGIAARLADTPSADPRVDSRPYLDGRYLLAVSRQPGGTLASEFAQLLADVAGSLAESPVTIERVWEHFSTTSPPSTPGAMLELSEATFGERELSFLGIKPGAALTSMYDAFLNHYVGAYRECIEILYPVAEHRPRRLKFNGGFAAQNASFRLALGESLGLKINDIPLGDLALLGLRELMVHAIPGGNTHDPNPSTHQ